MKTVTVTTTVYVEITNAEAALIISLYAKGNKVTAVVFIRDQHGLILNVAKALCEQVFSDPCQFR